MLSKLINKWLFCICLFAGVSFLLVSVFFVFENNASGLVILRYFVKYSMRKLTFSLDRFVPIESAFNPLMPGGNRKVTHT